MSGLEVNQSVLAPAGVQASSIHALWSVMLWTCTAVYIIVIAALLVALVRGRRNRSHANRSIPSERSLSRSVGLAVAATALILITFLVASVSTGRKLQSLQAASAVTIAVTGHQWWWEIEYEEGVPSLR